ncbi:Conserved_hypothetical protein [Hexamita inflata]|uniref:Uncharacterized protein n=1 Tax=Hexamita inflata TaxID=28002 RepID=A0AA86R8R4_9EUKA|nr:Conserved hypothetical protein [Hexamita inflata]
MDRQALLGQLLHIQQSLNTFVIQKVPKPQTAPINQLQRQNTDSKQVARAYLPQLINYWKQLDISKKESSFAYQQLSNNADKINDYLYQLKLLSQLKTEYVQVQTDFEQNYSQLRDILEMKVKKLPHEVAQIFVNCQLSFERLALTSKNARQFIKQPLVFPNLEYFECNVFTDLLKRSIFNKQSLPTLLFLTNFGSMVQTRSVISKWYELGPFTSNQLDLMFFLSIDYSAPPNLALNLCQRFKRHLQFLINENYTLDSKSVQQFVLDESEQLALFRVSYLKQNRNPVKFPFFGLLPKIFHFEHVPGYTISDLDYKLQLDHQNVQNNIQNNTNNNLKLPSFKSSLFSKPPEIAKISENEPYFNQFAQIKLKRIKIKPKTNNKTNNKIATISLPEMFPTYEPERIEAEDSLETSPEQNKQMRIVKLPLVNEIGEFEPPTKQTKVKSARTKSPVKVKIQQAEVKQEDSFDEGQESDQKEVQMKSPVKEVKFEKDDSFDAQEKSPAKNIETKTPKKKSFEYPQKQAKSPTKEVKLENKVKEDSFDDEPVQKEVKTSKTPKKEEAKAAVKPVEVKKEDSFDDEPVQKEVKTSKTPKKEEAKAAAKPVEVKKEDSFDDEPVQKEVKTSKTPKKEEAKAAAKPVEAKKEDSFDDDLEFSNDKEDKQMKSPVKEIISERKQEDSFDGQKSPVKNINIEMKTPKKNSFESNNMKVKCARITSPMNEVKFQLTEVKQEDSFDDGQEEQPQIKTQPPIKDVKMEKQNSFDKPEELQEEGAQTKTEYDKEIKLNEDKSLEANQLVNNKQDLKSNDEPKSTQKLTEQSYKSPAPNRLVVDDSFITPSRPADEYEDFVDNTSSAKLLQQVQQNTSLVEPQNKNQSTESKQKPPIAPIKSPLMANEYLNDEEEEQEEENEEYFDENTKNAFIDKVMDLNQIVIKMGQRTLKKRTREIKVSESAEGIFDEQVEKTEDNDGRPKAREGRGRR